MKTLHFFIILLLFSSFLLSQTEEYYFRLKIDDASEIHQLTQMVSIDKLDGKYVYAYANDQQWIDINRTDYDIERLPHPGSLHKPRIATSLEEMQNWDFYPSYPLYLTMMQQFADSFPQICKLDTFGYSVNGRQLLAVKITGNVNDEEDEPEFFYTSSMHGDELVGYVLMLRLIDYLLHQYGQGTPEGLRVTNMVDNMEIWINPLFNPDGTFRSDTTVSNPWRFNTNGVDLNRDFPDRINDPVNTPVGREAETQAMMAFAAAHNFNLSANFHGGAQVANYPWDNGAPSGQYSACPDDVWFIDIATDYASTNPDLLNGGFTNGITNGCDWYEIFGGRQDWIYYWHGGRELTIELWNTKFPSGSVLPQRWANNKESLLSYMEQPVKGVRGIVTDASTGNALWAQIDVDGYAEVPVYTDPDVGDFHRMLLPGNYTLYVRAPHYYPDTLYNVVVDTGNATQLNVALQKLPNNSIVGQVMLADTSFYGGTKVQVQGKTAFTNSSGYFELNGIFAGQLQVQFSKAGYSQTTVDTSFDALSPLWIEAELSPSEYRILLIDDDGGERQGISGEDRSIQKAESPIENVYQSGQSANVIESALNDAGFEVIRETSSQTDLATWQNYSLLFWSSGAETSPINSSTLQNALLSYGQNNLPLIVEGGEVGYEFRYDTDMKNNVLHFTNWNVDNAGALAIQNPTHPITQGLPPTIPVSYLGYGDQDAVTPVSGSQLLLYNTNYSNTAGLLINGQHLFYAFNLAAINEPDASQLVFNSANYFLPLSPDTHDLALYEINGISHGEVVQQGLSIPLSATVRNYGLTTEPPGIPIEFIIEDDGGNVLFSAQANTSDTLFSGDEALINFGDWMVQDTIANLQVKATIQLASDDRTGNDSKTIQITSLSTDVIFTEDFEIPDSLQWKIVTTDTTGDSWHSTYLPALGRHSIRVNPSNDPKEDWLISPQLDNPSSLFFYWDCGSDQIKDTLLVLGSSSDDSLQSFSDTLLKVNSAYPDTINHFNKMSEVVLNSGIKYIAFIYKGSDAYFAIDNIAVSSTITAVSDQIPQIPDKFSLMPNYPNPFNPSTTIQYSLPKTSKVRLTIFDILGKEVNVLVSERQKAGVYLAEWKGKSRSGAAVASGLYFYRLQTPEFSLTRKMLLVK
jgi:hypothetical protein